MLARLLSPSFPSLAPHRLPRAARHAILEALCWPHWALSWSAQRPCEAHDLSSGVRGRAALFLARSAPRVACARCSWTQHDCSLRLLCCAGRRGPTRSARPKAFSSAALVRILGFARLNFARLAQSVAHLTSIQLLNQSGGCGPRGEGAAGVRRALRFWACPVLVGLRTAHVQRALHRSVLQYSYWILRTLCVALSRFSARGSVAAAPTSSRCGSSGVPAVHSAGARPGTCCCFR